MKTILEIYSADARTCEHFIKKFESIDEIRRFIESKNGGDSFGYGYIDTLSGDIFDKSGCPRYTLSFDLKYDKFNIGAGDGDNARKSRRERDKMYRQFINDHFNGRCVLQTI